MLGQTTGAGGPRMVKIPSAGVLYHESEFVCPQAGPLRCGRRPRSAYRTSSLTSSPLISIDVLPFILFCIRRDPRPSQPTQRCEERRFPGAAPNPAETFRSPPAASAPPCPGRHGATYLYRLHYTGFSRLCPPYFPHFRSHLWKTMPQLKFFLPPPKK